MSQRILPIERACRLWLMVGLATVALVRIVAADDSAASDTTSSAAVQFNRDIRPLLSDNCFQCHGPDPAQRQADLRLDVEASAKRDVDGVHPVVPGDLDASMLYQRIASKDDAERMPPADSGKHLTGDQIELIGRWIRRGAKWEPHWAFIPPERPTLPPIQNSARVENPIDWFVQARLEGVGLTLSPPAAQTTLLRRVTLDLTGLPPTPAEIDAFLADEAPGAYERAIDRLLASPRYGERMAARWLDAARYADTNGYQDDGIRHMWRWRDWVIEAYNRNLPFDQFTIEQLAGDLLPGATLEQRLATGFNRNHRTNAEGGIIPEEYAVEYVVDRVDTTATVWMGLTVGCARCHDHKFDPVTQREFYQLFAYFNNVPERGRGIKTGNSPPSMLAPTRDQQAKLAAVEQDLARAKANFTALADEVAAAEAAWCESFTASQPIHWLPDENLVARFPLDATVDDSLGKQPAQVDGHASFSAGTIEQAASFDGDTQVDAGDVGDFGYFDKFTFAAWIKPERDSGTLAARMAHHATSEGYSLELVDGKLQVNLSKRWLDDALRVETRASVALDRWQHVAVSYDGTRGPAGIGVYVDGVPQDLHVLLDGLNQNFSNHEPLRIGGGGVSGKFQGLIDELRVYDTHLDSAAVAILATPEPIDALVALVPEQRSNRQAAKLRAYFLANHALAHVQDARRQIAEAKQRKLELEESFPTTMVMVEMPTPRDTFLLERGQYDKPAEQVSPGVPAALNPLPADSAPNRLAFARWLVDRSNPLTARVAVNRFWQAYFGTGLVKTVDDFGAQGEAPSHPQLLDWLASEFVASGWDIKAMQRLIITSGTYRQTTSAPAELFERDPDNRLLARGPRLRLPAEMIRDAALAASGLLVEQQGGPSVKPYQPPGLWKELTGGQEFQQDHGAGLYRRSLYTYWKRTIAPPSMITFDASPRESCTVRETRTNTPLQALTLLNETTFVEAARVLAQRVLVEESAPTERLATMFQRLLGRLPGEREAGVLERSLARHLERYRAQPADAEKLLSVGEAPRDKRLDACELAAYAAVANLVFNLDEAVTKE